MGYLKSHDYDLLMIICLCMTMGFLISYFALCNIIDRCCFKVALTPKGKIKKE